MWGEIFLYKNFYYFLKNEIFILVLYYLILLIKIGVFEVNIPNTFINHLMSLLHEVMPKKYVTLSILGDC